MEAMQRLFPVTSRCVEAGGMVGSRVVVVLVCIMDQTLLPESDTHQEWWYMCPFIRTVSWDVAQTPLGIRARAGALGQRKRALLVSWVQIKNLGFDDLPKVGLFAEQRGARVNVPWERRGAGETCPGCPDTLAS